MSLSTSGRTWEEASSPDAVRLARRFERAWRESPGRRPALESFLADLQHDQSGAKLALFRTEMALRWENGERIGAEWYRDRYPDLGNESLVALIYEEFCLREEQRDAPGPDEYLRRFPEVADRLQRVLDIHGLVGSGQTTASFPAYPPEIAFPEAGQTIAGFRLVEELGRGAFARVFLAEERQLADRPVAIKVARSGSREPQTLARLQHTNIVPIHSTQTDPASGLHLLCMPYFGRVTLARLLSDTKVRAALTGAEIVVALDRLGLPETPPTGRSTGRLALSRRSYAQAIAWWGARLAEGLQHAHERGVLHRDIKPSNVLVTADGMPMLLDFNLARETVLDDTGSEPGTLGGTLDYMAPEHLEALADGLAVRVDGRADIYGLGVLLYEALMGARPFATPRSAVSACELLLRAAEERRVVAPWLRIAHPEIPVAFESVVRRCLAPNPDDRYANAGDLATDLQAVADDQPLRFAREPLAGRATRWVRQRRRALVMISAILAAVGVMAASALNHYLQSEWKAEQAQKAFDDGKDAYLRGEYAVAKAKFGMVETLTSDNQRLENLNKQARLQSEVTKETERIRRSADAFFVQAEPLQFRLLNFGGNVGDSFKELLEALNVFYVLKNKDWAKRPEMKLLDATREARLVREVDKLLFLFAVAQDRRGYRDGIAQALRICDRALVFTSCPDPWSSLRVRLNARLTDPKHLPVSRPTGACRGGAAALDGFEWGLLLYLEGQLTPALEQLRQAVQAEPHDYWYRYTLGFLAEYAGASEEAFLHYEAAVALRPDSAWVRFNRARIYRQRGEWERALDGFRQALEGYRALVGTEERLRLLEEAWQTRLERGLVYQAIGDFAAARADYDWVIGCPSGEFARAARLDRAALDDGTGQAERALAEYNALIAANPLDRTAQTARRARALLAIRLGRGAAAEADLDELVRQSRNGDPQALADRALLNLSRQRAASAEPDAAAAFRLEPMPARRRLWLRTLVALERVDGVALDDPETLRALPVAGAALRADLRDSADRLASEAVGADSVALRRLINRAVILAALGDPAAEREADTAVELAPLSPQVYLIRSRIRRLQGARGAALADVDRGLELQPDNAQLWIQRGLLDTESGDPRAGLADLDEAARYGAGGQVHGPKALAWFALNLPERSVREWTLGLSEDPEDPRAYLGRARAFARLRRWSDMMADLEQAAAWADDRPALSVQIAITSMSCLAASPAHFSRVLRLVQRAYGTVVASQSGR